MRHALLSALAVALAGCAGVSAQEGDTASDAASPVESAPAGVSEESGDAAAEPSGDEPGDGETGDGVVDADSDVFDPATAIFAPAENRDAALAAINSYLDGLDVLTGSFLQIEPTGAVSTGEFWLDRPGRVRFEYADPHPFTIVADGATYTVWDRELEDVNTRVPLRETPLNMFLRRDVNLGRDAIVVDVRESPEELAVTLKDPDERVEGLLTLVFARPAIELRRMITTDATGAETEIAFTSTTRGGRVDPAMFVIREDRRRRGR